MSDDNPNIVRVPRTRIGQDQLDQGIEYGGESYPSLSALKQSAGFDSAAHGSVSFSMMDLKLASMPMSLAEYADMVSEDGLVNVRLLNSVEAGLASTAAADKAELAGLIEAEQSRAEDAENDLQSAIGAEEARALAAEGVLTTDLAAEVARATAAEGVLTTDLAAEVSRATGEEARIEGILNTEVARATAAEGVLTTDLATEVSRATGEESRIEAKFDGEVERLDGRIDFVASNVDPAALDSLSEIVTAFQDADGEMNATISNLAATASTDRALIRTQFAAADDVVRDEFAAADALIEADLVQEIADRAAGDQAQANALAAHIDDFGAYVASDDARHDALVSDLGDEVARATAAEAANAQAILDEAAARAAADTSIQDLLAVEQQRAQAAESSLGDAIDDLAATAEAADEANALAISNEVARATAAEAANAQAISDEADRAAAAEAANAANLAAQVVLHDEEMNVERTLRAAGDAAAMAAIGSEEARAMAAEAGLVSSIADLAATAEAADEALQSAIDAEIGRASAAEAANAQAIVAEQTARAAADQVHTDDIAAIVSSFDAYVLMAQERHDADVAALTNETNRASGAEAVNAQAIADEGLRAVAAEAVNAQAISDEETRALAAEGGLQDAIDAEESRALAAEAALGVRIDNVLSNTDPAALDSLSEVVTAFQAADQSMNGAISDLSAAAAADRGLIRTEFAAGDATERQFALDARVAMKAELDGDIAQEIADRAAGDEAQANALAAHIDDFGAYVASDDARHDALVSDLGDEVARATAAEAAIAADLAQELIDRAAGDEAQANALTAHIEAYNTYVTTAGAEHAADVAALNAETARAQLAEAGLADDISGLDDLVAANKEEIEGSLATEVSARTTADADLQAQIDALTSSSSGAVAAEQARAMAAEAVLTTNVAELNADVLALHGRAAMAELVADADYEAGMYVFGADLFGEPVMVTAIYVNGMRLHSSEFNANVTDGAFDDVSIMVPVYVGDAIVIDAMKKIDLQS